MAQALGIDAERVNRAVFALGSGVAGLAGACLAFLAPVTPTVGMSYVVDAFLVVIVGGAGSVAGAALAALGVGGLRRRRKPSPARASPRPCSSWRRS
ncbi:MAG: hypothetical protein R2748_18795 [Bryobacterales bacterium]